jgi:hypothetical protein
MKHGKDSCNDRGRYQGDGPYQSSACAGLPKVSALSRWHSLLYIARNLFHGKAQRVYPLYG